MNCAISINLSLKNQNFTLSGCKEIGIQQFEVEAKTQFLCFLHTSEKKIKTGVSKTTKRSQSSTSSTFYLLLLVNFQ